MLDLVRRRLSRRPIDGRAVQDGAGEISDGGFAHVLRLHFLGETHEGALRRLARRFRSRFVQHQSQLFIAVAQFHTRDDRLPLLRLQTLERLFVRFDSLTTDGCL